MKKKNLLFTLIASTFFLTSCTITFPFGSSLNDSTTSSEHSESSEESSVQESSSVPSRYINRIYLSDDSTYKFGTVYEQVEQIKVKVQYSDGQTEPIDRSEVQTFEIKSIKHKSGQVFTKTDKLSLSGEYSATINVKVGTKSVNGSVSFNVLSGLESNLPINDIDITSNHNYVPGDYFLNHLDVTLRFDYGNDLFETLEINKDNIKDYPSLSFNLYKQDNTLENIIDLPLVSHTSYVLKVEVNNIEYGEFKVELLSGVIKLEKEQIAFKSEDIMSIYSPSTGSSKVLVIPFILKNDMRDGKAGTFTNEVVSGYQDMFFGDNKDSFKYYYETASFGALTIDGFIADPVDLSKQYSISSLRDGDIISLHSIFPSILNKMIQNHPEIDISDFDVNDDGCLDNVHLIHNYGESEWGGTLWPHMSATGKYGTVNNPAINVYSINNISACTDAITAIHEQGHIFGLSDYYDYAENSTIDYVGGADMQSFNIFDWNSYSKFSVGWVAPYIVDGSNDDVTVTLSPASVNGDFLVIPADYNTYNNSAFDEYIMIELFSPYGLNKDAWNTWNNYRANVIDGKTEDINLGECGVRLYHVDSRLFGHNGYNYQEVSTLPTTLNYVDIGCNNSSDASAYPSGYSKWQDYKLLNLIQAHGRDTFGENHDANVLLNGKDLFHEGDVFTFDKYKHFFSKSGKTVTSMNNGEQFDWTIEFVSMSKDEVTIRIHK